MGLSLRGSTSGAIDINPPAVAGDNAITLPTSNGSANQFFKNSGTAGIVTYSSMVEKSDKIGIGTDDPNTALDVAGPISLRNGSELNGFRTNSDGKLEFFRNASSNDQVTLVIDDANGNIGIGTDNPASLLHMSGSAPRIILTDTAGTDDNAKIFSTSGALYLQQRDGSDHGEIIFRTENNSTATERLRITSAGKVGLGETSPLGQFHIKTGDSGASSVGASADEFVIEGSAHSGMTILSGTTSQGLINFADSGDVNVGNITYDHNSNFMSFKTTDAERLRILSGGGITFNGDTATANALDDYEEGTITTWRLVKSDANTNGSNNAETEVQYTKIGRCVYISGHIRTDSTETGKSGNLKLVSTADGSTAATLPFVPNHRGGLPIVHTRSCAGADTTFALSVGFDQGSSTVYVYANDGSGDYILDSNTLDTNTQTNLVITFNGHYFTNS